MKNILLHRIDRGNLGDILMAFALSEIFDREDINILAARPGIKVSDPLAHAASESLFWSEPQGRTVLKDFLCSAFLSRLPLSVRRGLRTRPEIHAILEVSGYRYAEHFGVNKAVEAATHYQRLAQRGVKIILPPKTFGPFLNDKFALPMSRIYKAASFIAARDEQSKKNLGELIERMPGCENWMHSIPIFPDFTSLVGQTVSNGHNRKVCLIPSVRVVESGILSEPEYLIWLERLVDRINQNDLGVDVLFHDRKDEIDLRDKITAQIPKAEVIGSTGNYFEIRRLISQYYAVISGRFHGAASALSAGVPTVVIAWAHKYKHLMGAHGVERYCIDPKLGWPVFEGAVQSLLNQEVNIALRSTIKSNLTEQREKSEALAKELRCLI